MSKKIETRKCAVCGKKFTPKAVNQAYCSKACKAVAKRNAEQAKRGAKKVEKKVVSKAKVTEKIVLGKKRTAENKILKKDKTVVAVHPADPFKAVALAFMVMLTEADKIIRAHRKPSKSAKAAK